MASETGKLLVVDDDENNRDMLARRLQRKGYEVGIAVDGEDALDLIPDGGFDLILLDVMMPRLNGYEVLKVVRESYSMTDLPVIMATAKNQSEDIVQALESGANDYVTKPLDFQVVLARVQTQLMLKRAIESVKRLEVSLTERNQELEQVNGRLQKVNQRMAKDLQAAAKIQESTLPRKLPKTSAAEFAWIYRPCDELAGDGLNVFQLDDRHIGLYVLDVSGHGVASALLSVTLSRLLSPVADASTIVRHAAEGQNVSRVVSPVEVADQLNRQFGFDSSTEQYFTIIYGVLDLESGLLRYITAGHPGLVFLPKQGEGRIIETPGFPVGFSEEPYAEHQVQLSPGDRILAYSDGIPEAMDSRLGQFGGDRIVGAMTRAASMPLKEALETLMADVTGWCGADHIRDDMCVLGVEYRGPGGVSPS